MKNFSINNLMILLLAVIFYQNNCVKGAIPDKDIKFELYKHHASSLQETFVALVDKPEVEGEIIDTFINEAANDVPAGGGLALGIKEHFESDADYEKAKEVEREKAVAIMEAIKDQIKKFKKFEIEQKLEKFEYSFEKSTNLSSLNGVDTELNELVGTFAAPSSPYQDDPTFVASIILPLATFVESFMKIVKLEEQRTKATAFRPIVPCRLAHAIKDYFIPTLFDRLDEINVYTDQYKFEQENKFTNMHETLQAEFNPDGYTKVLRPPIRFVRCDHHHGGKAALDREIERYIRRFKSSVSSFGRFGQTVNTELNMDANDVRLLKDNLGNEDDFFLGVTEYCVSDYFSLVRHRLEQEFGKAYKKVQQFCTLNRDVTKTGRGWLTLKVGAVNAKNGNSDLCDVGMSLSNSKAKFCDPIVKLVSHPVGGDAKPEEYTKTQDDSPGWTLIGDKKRFEAMNKQSSIHSEIWDSNAGTAFDNKRLFESNANIGWVLNHTLFTNNIRDNLSKLIMVAIWRDEIRNEKYTSQSNSN